MTRTYGTLRHQPAGSRHDASPSCFAITAEPHVMMRLKRVLPRVQQARTGTLLVSDTSEVARDLEWVLQRWPLEQDFDTAVALRARADEHRTRQDRVARVLAGGQGRLALCRDPARPARPYQQTAADLLLTTRQLLLADEVGLGKAMPLDEPVLTPTGYRPIGSLQVGDEVLAADGSTTLVSAVHDRGERDVWRLTFSDGATVRCCDEHLWKIRRSAGAGRDDWSVRSLSNLMARGLRDGKGQARFHVPMWQPCDLDLGGPRPLDPYVVGVLLGDGSLTGKDVRLSSADDELLAEVQSLLPPDVRLVRSHPGRPYDYRLVYGPGNPVLDGLRLLGMQGVRSLDKRVPRSYLWASLADRLSLLQGLMDTDGYAMPLKSGTATAQFFSSSPRLAHDVRWLAQSLGGTGRLSSSVKAGRRRYVVTVNLPAPLNPFRLSRKAKVWGDGHATLRPTRAIVDATYLGREPVRCIAVEHPDRLYVADEFVVTHNTQSAVLCMLEPDTLPAVVVCLTHLPKQWCREIHAVAPWLTSHIAGSTRPYNVDADVLVIPYSKIAGWRYHLSAADVGLVVFDEVQEIRRRDSEKYTAARQVAHAARYRFGLSATPIYNYGGEVHNIFDVLAPGALGEREEFIREWGGAERQKGQVVLAEPNALGNYLVDQALMLRRTRSDVGRELPDIVRVTSHVDADLQRLDEVAVEVEQLAQTLLAGPSKQRFAAAGEMDWKLRQATGLAKAPYVAAFVRLLLDSEQRIVLFGWHRAVYERWAELLADFHPRLYTGSESPAQKDASVRDFTTGTSRVLMVSLRAGAGLDGLQHAARVCVFGELDWSPGIHHQCEGRLHRDGQTDPVLSYFLVADDGSDPVIAETLELKRGQSEPLLDPEHARLATPDASVDRMRRLAAAFLERRGTTPNPAADDVDDLASPAAQVSLFTWPGDA